MSKSLIMYVSAKSLSDTLEHLIQLEVAKFNHWGRSVMTGLLCELYIGRDKHLGIGGDKFVDNEEMRFVN